MSIPLIGVLSTLDLIFLGLLIVFAALGAWKGFIQTLFQTAAWFAGGACAWFATGLLPPILQANIAGLPTFGLQAVSGILGFLVGFLVIRILGRLLDSLVSNSALSGANRWGGALIGAIKATILSALVLYLLQIIPAQGPLQDLRNSSQSYHLWVVVHPIESSMPEIALPERK